MLVTLLGLVVSLVALVASPLAAPASAATGPWDASGPGTVTTPSNGVDTAAQMTYATSGAGFDVQSWDFSSEHVGDADEVRIPYTWQGFHAYFDVTAKLEMWTEVGGTKVYTVLEDHAAGGCCTTPSGGFLYGGVATFDLQNGQDYGFRLSGSNFDSDNRLEGTFTLSSKPYLELLGAPGDNRQWTGAADLEDTALEGAVAVPGEARWYKIDVSPGQTVTVDLEGRAGGRLPADYDVSLYGDIAETFGRITEQGSSGLASLSSSAVADTQVPDYPPSVQTVPTALTKAAVPGPSFAPRAYAPRAYAPRAYAPRAYAPRAYAPGIFSPRSFTTDLDATDGFRAAFTSAQTQSLIAVSAKTGNATERLSARTGNTTGDYYVRVQGHTETAHSATPFQVRRELSGGEGCRDLDDFDEETLAPGDAPDATGSTYDTVIVTDTSRATYADGTDVTTLRGSLERLADATDGVVLDLAGSERVSSLWDQVDGDTLACPYATNLVAQAIDELVESYQQDDDARYVVAAGGDEVVPFFRYPDISGLGQESQFAATMKPATPAGESLLQDQVLGQDAYGSRTDITIAGAVFPVPDLAVGRLVKNAAEIEATVEHFVDGTDAPQVKALPTPTSSLVTGYDFLADAATAMDEELRGALGGLAAGDPAADTLIEDPGTAYADSWNADDLADRLQTKRSMVYLAGHFSANDTLAANFDDEDTFAATELQEDVYDFTDTLVMSAGCHSGYAIVDKDAASEDTYDWTQAFANEKALLIAGTGYQYGDTEFLEYSERLYLGVARALRRGAPGTPVPVGEALATAKRDYLATLSTVTGIDEKAVLQATMYGLPMVGLDVPGRTTASNESVVEGLTPQTGPGESFGLATSQQTFDTEARRGSRALPPVVGAEDGDTPSLPTGVPLSWLEGDDGVSTHPGLPVLPKQVVDVTVDEKLLRGVGFRSGSYNDEAGVLPLTGAPAIEGSTSHTTFESAQFWPQTLWSTNYFDALGTRGSKGRTSLVLTPAQHRSAAGALTNTRRAYADLGLELFYSADATSTNPASQAAAPAVTDVRATLSRGQVTFSAQVTGDPAAGVQKVWVTWTGNQAGDSGRGTWESIDLQQDTADTTRWATTVPLPTGQSRGGMRFLVQAANGVGAVSLDAADGAGYGVSEAGVDDVAVRLVPASVSSFEDIAVEVGDAARPGTTLPGRAVEFTLTRGDLTLTSVATTDDFGVARMSAPVAPDSTTENPVLEGLPSGRVGLTARVVLLPDLQPPEVPAVVETELVIGGLALDVSPASLSTAAGTTYDGGLEATVTDARGPVADVPVTFSLPSAAPTATFPGGASTWTGSTGADGVVTAPAPLRAGSDIGLFEAVVATEGVDSRSVPMASQYGVTPWGSPVADNGVTTTKSTATVPLKTSLLADGAAISDAAGAALVSAQRVQISWRSTTVASDRGSSTRLTRYVADKDLLQSDLKPSALGWKRGRTYEVSLTVLPSTPLAGLHLGSRSALIRVS